MTALARASAGMLALSLLAVACAESKGPPEHTATAPRTTALRVTMTDFRYSPDAVSAPPGSVAFTLVNAGSAGHDLTLLGLDGKRRAASGLVVPGTTQTFVVRDLTPGRYRFFCSQSGHEELGMAGALDVTG